MRLAPFEEATEDINQRYGLFNAAVELDASVLEENGAGWRLKEDVRARIFGLALLAHLRFEIVFGVLGLPVAAREVECVEDAASTRRGC